MKKILLVTVIIALLGSLSLYSNEKKIEKIRVLSPNNIPVKILVVLDYDKNEKFVKRLLSIITSINGENNLIGTDEEIHLHIVLGRNSYKERFLGSITEQEKNFVEINDQITVGNDIWMQDWGEIGTVRYSGDSKEYPLIIDSSRGRGIGELPAVLSKLWKFEYIKNPATHRSGGDYGGNTEVTPDDVLVLGDTSTEAYRKMFSDNGYKDRMVLVETSWLTVGHCDEYLSFCPNKKSPTGYTIIRANPRQALGIIKRASMDSLAGIKEESYRKFLTEIHYYLNDVDATNNELKLDFPIKPIVDYSERELKKTLFRTDSMDMEKKSINHDLNVRKLHSRKLSENIIETLNFGGNSGNGFLAGKKYSQKAVDFVKMNLDVAKVITTELKKILTKVDEVRKTPNGVHSFLSFPLLYRQMRGGKKIAYYPGVVNMLVVRDNLVIPDTYIPFINDYIQVIADKLDLPAYFVDDMHYHNLQGEIHCGTNALRLPDKYIVKPKMLMELYETFMEYQIMK
ncbi:hypothetical protein KAJ27_11110 [bacterium]|nr:hypothetical protein [bacterium]